MTASLTASVQTAGTSTNQYCRPNCHLPLANALAAEYSTRPSWSHLTVDPMKNVMSSLGCTQVMYCGFRSLLSPGDEVVLLEPAFDIYAAQVVLCGGVPKFVSLVTDLGVERKTANDVFKFDFDALEAAITPRTKVLVLNTPHNPTGKMFTRGEQERIAGIVAANPNLTVFSDEVYEHIVYDPSECPHVSFATLPGMWERTVTMSSAGKTFSVTGWKVGWAVGPEGIIKKMVDLQQVRRVQMRHSQPLFCDSRRSSRFASLYRSG